MIARMPGNKPGQYLVIKPLRIWINFGGAIIWFTSTKEVILLRIFSLKLLDNQTQQNKTKLRQEHIFHEVYCEYRWFILVWPFSLKPISIHHVFTRGTRATVTPRNPSADRSENGPTGSDLDQANIFTECKANPLRRALMGLIGQYH